MKALYKEKNKKPYIKEIILPSLKKGEVKIKIELSGICRTDVYVANDKIYKNDVVLGHEFCGRVIETESNRFNVNDFIVCNPVFKDGTMLGVDKDGCFAEEIIINEKQVFKVNEQKVSKKLAAYCEPISASMSPLGSKKIKKNQKGLVFGSGRIAELTYIILKKEGFKNIELIDDLSKVKNKSIDFLIETGIDNDNLSYVPKILKNKGTFIVKSRSPNNFSINLYEFVKKDITIECLYYYNFKKAIKFMENNNKMFDFLFGSVYKLENWEEAFTNKENKKIFLEY